MSMRASQSHNRSRYMLLAMCLVLVAFLANVKDSSRSPMASSETRFVEHSRNGMQIVPASCPSNPHVFGECSCPTGATVSEDTLGYKTLAGSGDRKVVKFTHQTCVSNTGSKSYFVPANTDAELTAFMGTANALPGLRTSTYTSLLEHFNGTNGATVWTDSSYPAQLLLNGGATLSTAVSKFGGASAFFNGSTWEEVSANGELNMDTTAFTLDFWMYPTSNVPPATGRGIISRNTVPGLGYASYLVYTANTNQLYFYSSSANNAWDICNATPIGAYTLNTWTHIAIVKNGTTITTYKDGVAQGTCTSALTPAKDGNMVIGGQLSGQTLWPGYIDELRISRGIARWTANFTPPTAEYPY